MTDEDELKLIERDQRVITAATLTSHKDVDAELKFSGAHLRYGVMRSGRRSAVLA